MTSLVFFFFFFFLTIAYTAKVDLMVWPRKRRFIKNYIWESVLRALSYYFGLIWLKLGQFLGTEHEFAIRPDMKNSDKFSIFCTSSAQVQNLIKQL